jgi:DNA primase
MAFNTDLPFIRQLPICEIAKRLGINIHGNKAMCFGGHDSKTPSLSFSKRKNLWKCFGCDKGGDNIKLVMEVRNCEFKDAIDWIKASFNCGLSSTNRISIRPSYSKAPICANGLNSIAINEFHSDFELYSWFLSKCNCIKDNIGLNYLDSHGIDAKTAFDYGFRELIFPNNIFKEMVRTFGTDSVYRSGIAWGNNGRPDRLIWQSYTIIIPFFNNGKLCYIQGRQFSKDPKYLNLRGIQKPLYNLDCLQKLKIGSLIHICEGVPDVLALASKRIASVGVLGASSFREEWVNHFIPFDVILLPDGDSGGKLFSSKIQMAFKIRGKAVRIVSLPAKKDVSDIISEANKSYVKLS